MRARKADSATRVPPPLPEEPLGPLARVTLAGEIVASYLHARIAMRGAPIASTVTRLRHSSVSPFQDARADALEESLRLGRAVSRTLRFVPGDTRCLVSSLVLTRLLARREIPAKLVIGVRSAPQFLAHAWVEHAGQPVLPPGDDSFGRLVEL